jgi:Kae1-associated kinase Bud32
MAEKLEGAESTLAPCKFLEFDALKKVRISKKYRPAQLDEKFRLGRTRAEARLLHKCKEAGVLCPHVFEVGKDFIIIEKIEGKTLNKTGKKIELHAYSLAGKYLAQLHRRGIMHGDYTPANLMLGKDKKLYVIDFGLGYISFDLEDMAVDLLTMCDAIDGHEEKLFLGAYEKIAGIGAVKRMRAVQKRGRYNKRGK